ncbi:Odorant receptor [Nesidiocoris tenuis]|uniref:Odorant receptor n=1 Tax=Nesidiocoris tenuis TaxID=355587 RepID=A0ABN7AR21_9HEMI|nr:Odorant receptor [Nesidiocoris tenuis]
MSPTYEDEQKVVKALVKSGLLDWIGILGAFRSVQNERFPGTIGGKIYWWFEIFTDFTSIFNVVTMSIIIVMADKPGTRWLAAFPVFTSFLSIYLSLYPSVFIFASRLVAMFKTLKLNLRQILEALDEVNRNYPNFADREALSEHLVCLLKAWVIHHQQCLRIVRKLESLYSWPFAMYFGAWILVICTATLAFTDDSVDRMTVVICGCFLTGATIQLLMTSRTGDTITYEVDGLMSAIYGTDFHLLNKKEYRYLRIILTRCQQICVIQAVGLFPLSIETFKSIMTSSYSYYTMLKKMNEMSNQ